MSEFARPCIECGRIHDTVVQKSRFIGDYDGPILERLEKCEDCLFNIKMNTIDEQVELLEDCKFD